MSRSANSAPGAEGSASGASTTAWTQLAHMALWKKAIVTLSVLLMAAGLVLPLVLPADETPAAASTPGAAALQPGGFAPATGDGEADAAATDPAEPSALSPTLFRLGFSFFVGFAIAFAIRSFVKVSIVVIGLFLLFIFGLEYAGLVEVRWAALSERYDTMASWLEVEFSSFRSFVTGRLPAGAAAVAGLGLGFTRK